MAITNKKKPFSLLTYCVQVIWRLFPIDLLGRRVALGILRMAHYFDWLTLDTHDANLSFIKLHESSNVWLVLLMLKYNSQWFICNLVISLNVSQWQTFTFCYISLYFNNQINYVGMSFGFRVYFILSRFFCLIQYFKALWNPSIKSILIK